VTKALKLGVSFPQQQQQPGLEHPEPRVATMVLTASETWAYVLIFIFILAD
jgi:hypothetical protein